jgi:hypothetical protein
MINPAGGPNRPLYQRMPTATQQPTLIRQQYNSTGMINMNQNVPQMSIVKVRTFKDDERNQMIYFFYYYSSSSGE